MNKLEKFSFDRVPMKYIQMCCLVMVGLAEAFATLFGGRILEPFMIYVVMCINLAAAVHLGVTLSRPASRTARNMLLIGLAFCAWTVLLQLMDFRHFTLQYNYTPRFMACTFLCEYAMMLPYGSFADEKEKGTGIKVYGSCILFATVILSLFSIFLMMGVRPASIESILQWQGNRLSLMWHPNVLARAFMMGLGLGLAFACSTRKIWLKVLLVLLAVVEFVFAALTNSRTVIIINCCIVGGIVFFLIYRGNRSIQRFIAGMLVAVLVIALLFAAATEIYDINCDIHAGGDQLQEANLAKESGQRDLIEDLGSFNGRTSIWKGVLKGVVHEPSVMLFGTRDIETLFTTYNTFRVPHAHNAWIQTLAGLGLVGFAFAVLISWLAIKNCFVLLFLRESSMFQKAICLLVIAMMGTEFFEPYLFYVTYPCNFVQVTYMLLVGYVVYWGSLRPKKSEDSIPNAETLDAGLDEECQSK